MGERDLSRGQGQSQIVARRTEAIKSVGKLCSNNVDVEAKSHLSVARASVPSVLLDGLNNLAF